MKLKYKFFISFIIMSFLILFLAIGVTQINIRNNFIRFVNNTEFDKLTQMVSLLKKSYQQKNGWDDFQDNNTAWKNLLFQSRPDNLGPIHPIAPDHFQENKKIPPLNSLSSNLPRPMDPFTLHNRLCLFDADKQYIAGSDYRPQDKFNYLPINLSGKTIGWLGLTNQPKTIKPLELEFLKRQTQSFYTISAGIFILAILISYVMSRHLLSPIRELVRGTKAMGNLDFDTRIKIYSKDELGDLAEDFNLMAQTLKQYETLRKNWISDISHELRTPVAVIRSKIEALQDGIRVMTPALLNSLHNDILGLGKLVNDLHLISLSDSENLSFNRKTIDILKLIDQCLDTFFIRLEQQQIKIQTDWKKKDRFEIKGDAQLLSRVFNNLVENSLRYTDSPGTLKISHGIRANRLFFYIEDSSPGVPDNCLEHIFDRLYRVEQSRNRAMGGSGLGLSIAKQVIDRHRGEIEASRSPLGGLKIKLELPL
ncbi:MAG: HAMP domain-containing protein [Desulfobacteraceae bacterium]|nr:HAMP domain-containing protein [Desulfobacteraceae bacterium]